MPTLKCQELWSFIYISVFDSLLLRHYDECYTFPTVSIVFFVYSHWIFLLIHILVHWYFFCNNEYPKVDLEIYFCGFCLLFSTKLNNEGGKYSDTWLTECKIWSERTKESSLVIYECCQLSWVSQYARIVMTNIKTPEKVW